MPRRTDIDSVLIIGAGPIIIGQACEFDYSGTQVCKDLMISIGLDVPISGTAHTLEEARQIEDRIGRLPLIIRPAFTLGGTGGGIAYNRDEFEEMAKRGIELSPVSEILVEESLL